MSILESFRSRPQYDLTVVSVNESSKSRKNYSRKGYSPVKTWLKRIMSTLLALLILAGIALVGAAPSNANDSNDWGGFNFARDAICGTGYLQTDATPVGFQSADTYDKTMPLETQNITAYEKYGMAGLNVTAWLGPRNANEMQGNGDQAGKQLVTMAGGPGSLNSWGKGDSTDNAGHSTGHKAFYNTTDKCDPLGNVPAIAVTNTIFACTSGVVYATNWVYEMAFMGVQPMIDSMTPAINRIIQTLESGVYFEFLAPIIMLGALYMAWKGLVKRSSTEAASAAIWMIGAVTVGIMFMANPSFVPNVAMSATTTVNSAIMSSVAKATQQANPTDNLCALPVSDGTGAEATKTAVRTFQCENWKTFNYNPYVLAQFGAMPGTDDPNKQGWNSWDTTTHGIGPDLTPWTPTMIGNKAASNQTMALTQLDSKVSYKGADTSKQQKMLVQIAANQTYFNDLSQANTFWMGTAPEEKITVASVSFVGAVCNAIIVFIPSASIIMLNLMIWIGVMVGPIFLLVGAHPGVGKRVGLGWVESLVGFAIKMCTATVFLAVSTLIIHLVMQVPAQGGWMTTMGMVVLVTIALVKYLKPMLNFVGNVSFGGVSFMKGAETMGEQMAQRTAGLAKKGAVMGAGGVATVAAMTTASGSAGAGARKANKEAKAAAVAEVDAQDAAAGAGDRKANKEAKAAAVAEVDAQDAAAGAGDRPADKNAPDTSRFDDSSQSDADSAGAGERPAGTNVNNVNNVAEEAEPTAAAGAGDRPVARESVQEAPFAQPETARRVSDAEVETARIARNVRLREAIKNAPTVNTRKVMFKAAMEASRSRSVVGGFKTGTAVANRHKSEAQATQRTRLAQEAQNAKLVEQQQQADDKAKRDKDAAALKAKREKASNLKAEASLTNAELAKKRADEARARHEAKNKPGSGKHRGLPALN